MNLVSYINRRRRASNFSIELIFNRIRDVLKGKLVVDVVEVPQFNNSFFDKLSNWWFIYKKVKRKPNQVWHITGEIHYVGICIPSKKTVLTIHDCGFIHRKQGISRRLVTWLYLKWPLRFVVRVVTTTEEVRKDIVKWSGYPAHKISVIPVPVRSDLVYFPFHFNENKPRILQIGTAYNKNIERLIEALQGISCTLDIVGKLTNEHKELLESKGIDYQNSMGLTDEEIKQKYEACDMVTFVSTFEGFGMPIVEANAVGRPVITSNISSMPEVAGKAACLVDPFDIDSIRAGILKVIQEPVYRQELIQLGIENKKRFTSEEIASQYLGIYKELMYQ